MVNKILIGELISETEKSFTFITDNGKKRVWKRTISRLIDISNITIANTQFFIEKIEGALV
jgi:hypothetical protein